MTRPRSLYLALGLMALVPAAGLAQTPFSDTAQAVNKKMVKLFGSGARKLAPYGTGIMVSPDGYILTANSHILDTQDLRVHLYDGRRYNQVKIIATEPELDVALIKVDDVKDLPHYDIAQVIKQPLAQTGDWVLGFSNQFEIATLDEPVTVQRGAVAAYAKLHGRRGVFSAPFTGDVYIVDAITNNPGAAGGALTTRKGELLGIIGKELRNTQTDTYFNYAIPIQAKVTVEGRTVSIADFVEQGMKKKYVKIQRKQPVAGNSGYHGIVLVPNVVERTPPYVEELIQGSPGAKAGLLADDLIVYIDGEQCVSVKAFKDTMAKIPPNSKVTLEVRRGDKLKTVELTLIKEPVANATPMK